jgi:hypothetical protein
MISRRQENIYLIYIDESYDDKYFVYSAVFVPAFKWYEVFGRISKWRGDLYRRCDIEPEYELHSTKFTGGKGQPRDKRDKEFRADLFNDFLKTIEDSFEERSVINGISGKYDREKLFEYILNRIYKRLEKDNAYGLLICDEGSENRLVSIKRRMSKKNKIPLKLIPGQVLDVPIKRIIEDLLFKKSNDSYFIQIADMIAFALMRNKHPLEKTLLQVQKAFDNLDKILDKKAFGKDPRGKGIVRVLDTINKKAGHVLQAFRSAQPTLLF